MNIFDNDAKTRSAFHPTTPSVSSDPGSISAFRSGNTSALRALETIVEPGTIIDGFEVNRMLGRGSLAAVYDGLEMATNRPVALKILDARFSDDPVIAQKFLTEGETLALFDHPNICKHIRHGSDEHFVYIAMELIEGITLDQLIHVLTLEKHHYLHLAREVSKGLTRVHAEGIVHGDIKPSNILVTRPGEVKISDFGTAALAEANNKTRATTNKVSGTAAFMAPELFNKRARIDYRADIYSLAVTFYKVFTGKLPSDPYIPPTHSNPLLPQAVDGVLARALDENPEHRHVTAKEFCDALAAAFDENHLNTPIAITPNREEIAAAELRAAEDKINSARAEAEKNNRVDWKLVIVCGLAAIGLAAVLLVFAVYFGNWRPL